MNDRGDVGVFPIDAQMHLYLARRATKAFRDDAAVKVHDNHHVGIHIAFRNTRRRNDDGIGRDAHADIAVIGHNIALLIKHSTGVHNGLTSLHLIHKTHSFNSSPLLSVGSC